MENKWSDLDLNGVTKTYCKTCSNDLAARTYSSRLIGSEPNWVLHGGGNTSVKTTFTDILGNTHPAIYVKASGLNMAHIEPEGHPGLDLEYLQKLRALPQMSDAVMVNELRTHLFNAGSPTPSIETLVHAFIPKKFIDHTHADAILTLTNQINGESLIAEALGSDIIILEYVKAGFALAKAAADAYDANPSAKGMVLMHHGIITWGETAKESYDAMVDLTTKAEKFIAEKTKKSSIGKSAISVDDAWSNLDIVTPILRGLLASESDNPDKGFNRMTLIPMVNDEILNLISSDKGREALVTPALTADHIIRTKSLPLWIESLNFQNTDELKSQLSAAIDQYAQDYDAYVCRNISRMPEGLSKFDPLPQVVIIKDAGVLCAGENIDAAIITKDITLHTLRVKKQIAEMGAYKGLSEEHIFDMEYYSLQHNKLGSNSKPLDGETAIVTGAAGAIGSGICRGLLKNGCNVAVTDLKGENLDSLVNELKQEFGNRVIGIPIDVTNPDSVSAGIKKIVRTWGGVDIAAINAGVALVSSLKDMDLNAFRRLETINIEGTLITLREMAKHLELQGTGGDIIVTSTKNVFSPGATFGAYSATKAASHQLARIASLELAPIGVRVNMVAPDAVFSDGERKSGLWKEVGPGRMRSRGLDEKGLEEYYQSRNLLKAKITAEHVANAVLFFAMRKTPTTGATIPVDGGLPDATPR